MSVEPITKIVGAVSATIAMVGGGYTLADKVGWLKKDILMWAPEPYDPYSLLGTNQSTDYALPRAAIESIKIGSHKFLSEGTLTKTATQQVGPAGPFMQDMINDNRKFEGWRKTS